MRLTGWPDSGGCPTGCRGDPVTLRSPGNTPLGSTDGLCRANPLGQPARVRAGHNAGRTFCDPRTSCGDTNGSTLHVAKQVRGIQNPQSCRQAHRKSHLSGAPLLHLNRPDILVFRLPTQSAVVQMVVQWRTEGFRTSTPNVVCSIFKNVFQQTSNIDTEDRSSVSRCGPKTPSRQTD